jgi:hypothetical protein
VAKKEKNLSQEQMKIRILAFLYTKGNDGANAYTIQHKANIPSSLGAQAGEQKIKEITELAGLPN